MHSPSNETNLSRRALMQGTLTTAGGIALSQSDLFAAAVQPAKAPFPYVQAKAFHIPPETTTEESGYFSLCEGLNGKIYVGTAAYGRNSFLVEFDPMNERMRIVLDTHKVVGQKTTGYAAQAKLHTRNFVGPSGKIYVGSKQGYLSQAEREAQKRGEKIPVYQGGYVMVYDPAKDTTENLGMPMPLDAKRQAAGRTEGEGVIDVTADEARGLIYVVTCEHQHWMLYSMKTKTFRELGPILRDQPNTLIDAQGRGTAITSDFRIARYEPGKDRVTIDPLHVDGKPFAEYLGAKRVHPDWRIMPDGRTAYLQLLDDLRMFRVDLTGAAGQPVVATNWATASKARIPTRAVRSASVPMAAFTPRSASTTRPASAKAICIISFATTRERARWTTWACSPSGTRLSSISRATRRKTPMVRCVRGPDHTLPDGTLTPLHVIMAMIVARNGTIYATTIYPYTLLKIETVKAIK